MATLEAVQAQCRSRDPNQREFLQVNLVKQYQQNSVVVCSSHTDHNDQTERSKHLFNS